MLTKDIDFASENHKNISEKIESVTFNSIRKILPDKAIKDACILSGQRWQKGMSSHSFRYNFVRRSFIDLLNKGYSAKQAHAYLTEALFHHRQDADVPYLDALEGEFS